MLVDLRENFIQLVQLLWKRFDISQFFGLQSQTYLRMCVDDRFYFCKEELLGNRIVLPYLINMYALRSRANGYFLVHVDDGLVQVLLVWDVWYNLQGDDKQHRVMYLEIDFEKDVVCYLRSGPTGGIERVEVDTNYELLRLFLQRMNMAIYYTPESEDNDRLLHLISDLS